MAVDETIFYSYLQQGAPGTLRFYRWRPPAVSIGCFQDYRQDIDRAACVKKGYEWVRRPTGGRAVLHEDEITYCLVAGEREGFSGSVLPDYLKVAEGFKEGFHLLGVKVDVAPGERKNSDCSAACFTAVSWYEIVTGGKKLVGSAQRRKKPAFMQHGSILLRFHPENLLAVLGRKAGPQQVGVLRQQVTCLEEIMGYRPEENKVITALVEGLSRVLGISWAPGILTPSEKKLARYIKENKYDNAGWNENPAKSWKSEGWEPEEKQ